MKETVEGLASKVAELYRELVTNTVKFEDLRQYTKESLDEFKRLIERLNDKLEEAEKDRIRREVELSSKIHALESRLDALSEQALHSVAREAAIQVFEKMGSESAKRHFSVTKKLEPKQLPEQPEE
ncbi:hypothetical protein [Leptolyngbya sp. CCY15150]|uniref:hypothetical protein n=1 Tax=Leptolyngbya sp. CCY15150 TaxID=2767772 RepID=UPI0019528085|nr:hypothetical protein [Leptolyngbya sp. CCY15150]